MKIHPILLCGGSGTRLWPLSRKSYPKQFAKLMNEESLFQASARRFTGDDFSAPVILTGDPFRFIVTEQLAQTNIAPQAILIEPEGRNTAPAVLAAALWLNRSDPLAMMLVAPSDHAIPDTDQFQEAVRKALPRAQGGDLVTFGITPTRAETGYGYLELEEGENANTQEPQTIKRFVEKPASHRAESMVATSRYLWNSGIFLFTAEAIILAFRTHAPDIYSHVKAAMDEAHSDLSFLRIGSAGWPEVPDVSIDYAIMEKAKNLAVMRYSHSWSDLGGWDAVWTESECDREGNACSLEATAIDCENSLLRSETEGLQVVGIGLNDMIVVAMSDAVLVAPMAEAQNVKKAVDVLKHKNVRQAQQLPRDYRPWGWYESLVVGGRFQVKKIVVKPGAALSLQSHHHRSEHWIVVEGTAKVTVNNEARLVSENESVYIPLGAVHRMENPGKIPMVLIEVQTGPYLGEDDIERYEDIYSRK